MHFNRSARIYAALLLAGAGSWGTAQAVTSTYTVTSLAAGVGSCDGSLSCTTLNAALTAANALPASPGDDIRVVFDGSLNGDILHNGATPRMFDSRLGSTVVNDYLGVGAFLHVNAQRPLTIDFGNRVGAIQNSDNEYAMLYIQSSDVLIENFQNAARRDVDGTGGYPDAAGIMSAGSAIVIAGSRITLRNGLSSDPGTAAMESCISLVDGASDILVEDFYCRSSALFGLYVDERATVSNLALNRFETQGGQNFGDIWVEFGEGGVDGDKTVLNGFTVNDSEFRSRGINYTMGFRENSVISNLVITNSRFLGVDNRGIGVYPTAVINGLQLEDSTITGTSLFLFDNAGVAQSDYVIRNNTFSSVREDVILLTSPHSNALIEGNQFLNERGNGNVAGVRIDPASFGSNNVIRNNLFNQGVGGNTNRFAVWIRSNPGTGLSTGWSVDDNQISHILGTTFGPISFFGNGNTLARGNTFGEGTRGASTAVESEAGNAWFVNNSDTGTNGRIQTWRPTEATFTPPLAGLPLFDGSLTVTVAPVDPPLGGNTAPTLPVFVDVYLTESDQAERYVGRIPGSQTGPVTHTFATDAAQGFVRVQITDADGRSSQYSAIQQIAPQALPIPLPIPIPTPNPPPTEPPTEPPAPSPEPPLEARATGGAMGPWLMMLLGGFALLRRRMPQQLAAVAALLSVFGAQAQQAADSPGSDQDQVTWWRFYGGVSAGALSTNFDADGLTRALQSAGYAVTRTESDSDGIGYGLWLGYALNSVLGLELAYSTGADERVRFSGTVGNDLPGALDVAAPFLSGYGDSYLLRLRYHHALNESWFLSPRVGAGVTQTRQTFRSGDQVARFKDDSFTWAVGGGLHYALTRDWSVGVAADYYQTTSDNSYALLNGVLEWRFPQALPVRRQRPVAVAVDQPVQVIPVATQPRELVPAAAPTPAALVSIELKDVKFDVNSDQLTAESRTALNALATTLQQSLQSNPELQIEVAGHTDATGNEARNLQLSEARAQAVREYLLAQGVDGARLSAVGYGSAQPQVPDDTPEGRSRNRRVELKMKGR